MKKILLGLSVFLMTLVSAQNYPDQYPNSPYGNNQNYGDAEDEFYFPDDYYYQYPNDYYSNSLYDNYYNDYRQSINDVNWNRFFARYRLSPWQVEQIMMLNDSFSSYASWNSYYRFNPDRWYYDRFYALQRIMGPQIFVVFQNRYYNGYNPVVYYQNYNRRHYARNIYVIPRYRNINVNVYRVNRSQFHNENPRANIGFQPNPRNGTNVNPNGSRNNSFDNNGSATGNTRNNTINPNSANQGSRASDNTANTRNNSIRTENQSSANNGIRNQEMNTRNNGIRTQSQAPTNNGGFRNDTGNRQENLRNTAPTRKVESNSGSRNDQKTESRAPSSNSRNSGQRFTAR